MPEARGHCTLRGAHAVIHPLLVSSPIGDTNSSRVFAIRILADVKTGCAQATRGPSVRTVSRDPRLPKACAWRAVLHYHSSGLSLINLRFNGHSTLTSLRHPRRERRR